MLIIDLIRRLLCPHDWRTYERIGRVVSSRCALCLRTRTRVE
ncbi:hypothetical protein HNP84_007347 [Thermocatellispora tengchongensis]|uniref:Uncharacterized protein n=1 Tax=Thermocatellispora tengchongensis TaxID=1073253 RepID=A0A840PNJ1_9ACTN|nr:hypothetical protein [Thermocatellispora tengchongensis]